MRTFARNLLSVSILAWTVVVAAQTPEINEPAAFLVFPAVLTKLDAGPDPVVQTLLTIANTGAAAVQVKVTFVDGPSCNTCDFLATIPASGTISLNVAGAGPASVAFDSLEGTIHHVCPGQNGFVTVHLEDAGAVVQYDNVLIGSQVVVDYAGGRSFSLAAVPIQADTGDGDHDFEFDGIEFRRLARIVATDFLAPDVATIPPTGVDATLMLYTLGFTRGLPPRTDCSFTTRDADGQQFSNSLLFGCWVQVRLQDISPEFAYPNLGPFPGDPQEVGWTSLNCRVDADNNGTFDATGGVHGAIVQIAEPGAVLRHVDGGPALSGAAGWDALPLQSVTSGDTVTLKLESIGPVPDAAGR